MQKGRIQAVLGPTNTGKTHYAVERMLAYQSGVIGLPLRLLAREVYDRITAIRGPGRVALLTGEERIVPPRTQWWVCTTEAMPEGIGADFVAIDEIQLAADPERGHVFTDRLLHMRGLKETLLLGAETMRPAIRALVPEAEHQRRDRFSALSYTGSRKLSRMPPRSAVVGFSVDSVYAMAELLRRAKGGAAVVMGALSPRTRNAQVAMYQNGDVDYIVATDAIGMGLNLDIGHVAFSNLTKFDGRKMRPLAPNELGQIAGRAGRYRSDGSFGVTGEALPLEDDVARAIEDSRFRPLSRLFWRNRALEFGSPEHLIASLERPTDHPMLTRVRESDDLAALKALADQPETRVRASTPASVQLLWDVCRVPDFRGISPMEHAALLGQIFTYLHERGSMPEGFLAERLQRIDRMDGDIDALAKRLAYVRTWTYVTERPGWMDSAGHWRERARDVEDRLSDALHGALTQRFVDRRTSVLLKRLKQKESIVADVSESGDVSVEGAFIGRLDGFRFQADKEAEAGEARTLHAAAIAALTPHFRLRADRLYNAPDSELELTDQGGLLWGKSVIGKLTRGDSPMQPRVSAFVDDEAGPEVATKVARRLQHFIDRRIAALFEPLFAMTRDETLPATAKGFAYRLGESFGLLSRASVSEEVKELDQSARGALRKHGVRFGQFTVFMPLLLKPAPTRLRLLLWALSDGMDVSPEAPPPGLVTLPKPEGSTEAEALMSGYRHAGARMIRIDMLERLADLIRTQDTRQGFEAKTEMLSITGLSLDHFAELMQGLGYAAERGERPKVKPAAVKAEAAPSDTTPEEPLGPEEDSTDLADLASLDGATPALAEAVPAEAASPEAEAPVEASETATPAELPETAAPVELEVFYTFRWAPTRAPRSEPRKSREGEPRRRSKGSGPKAQDGGARHGSRQDAKSGPKGAKGTKPAARSESRAPREKKIDPDNPFAAALAGLTLKE